LQLSREQIRAQAVCAILIRVVRVLCTIDLIDKQGRQTVSELSFSYVDKN